MKTILITGSTSGIGLGIAREFAKTKQYNIVFNGLEPNGPEIAEGVGKEFGIQVMFSPANMMKPEELKKMVDDAIVKFGAIDILVNNAGIQHVSPIEDFPEDKWNAIIAINLTSVFHLTKAVWKGMKERKFGRIINIASAHGLVASEFKSAYVAAKHGIVGFTKTIALEGAPFNITANAICPGYVKTPLVEKQIADQAKAHQMSEADIVNKVMLYKQAVKEFVPVEVLGQLALFLASEGATTLTGTALPVDGGWNAQ
ncbi:MAG: 3-hydroxybutyrate dehydrogenase [Bacteroidetes bacterium]|nr:3-hydroxybutyrate dehydrogenase [Bacteroidota bacterium]